MKHSPLAVDRTLHASMWVLIPAAQGGIYRGFTQPKVEIRSGRNTELVGNDKGPAKTNEKYSRYSNSQLITIASNGIQAISTH